ncbi:SMC-Scp complex subunit ScpB [Candidatus Micrarchaeota archaeon]|nr:SMC-Scp complex subunit ScpB [Candidatus Micrarchaeota archaeon]
MDKEKLLEAALFISGREIDENELAKLLKVRKKSLEKILEKLSKRYENSAVQIRKIEENYIMRLKDEYVNAVEEFAHEPEFRKGTLKTLSFIAKNPGIMKSELCKRLGSRIYEDVKILVEKGFVQGKKHGRSTKLDTTKRFKAYFGI